MTGELPMNAVGNREQDPAYLQTAVTKKGRKPQPIPFERLALTLFLSPGSLAGELGQPLLVGLDGLELGLPLEVLLRRHQEEGNLAALRARAADALLRTFALAPRS